MAPIAQTFGCIGTLAGRRPYPILGSLSLGLDG